MFADHLATCLHGLPKSHFLVDDQGNGKSPGHRQINPGKQTQDITDHHQNVHDQAEQNQLPGRTTEARKRIAESRRFTTNQFQIVLKQSRQKNGVNHAADDCRHDHNGDFPGENAAFQDHGVNGRTADQPKNLIDGRGNQHNQCGDADDGPKVCFDEFPAAAIGRKFHRRRRAQGCGFARPGEGIGKLGKGGQLSPFNIAVHLHQGHGIQPSVGNPLAQFFRGNRPVLFQVAADDFVVGHNRVGLLRFLVRRQTLRKPSFANYVFRTNNFPGNCLTARFISSPNNATDTAELGRPLRRMTSSMADSSRLRES